VCVFVFYLPRAYFCIFDVFSVCFVLSVPVQVIAWKDSSPKWSPISVERDVKL